MQRAQGTHKCDTLTREGHSLRAIGPSAQIHSDHNTHLQALLHHKPQTQDSRTPALNATYALMDAQPRHPWVPAALRIPQVSYSLEAGLWWALMYLTDII